MIRIFEANCYVRSRRKLLHVSKNRRGILQMEAEKDAIVKMLIQSIAFSPALKSAMLSMFVEC